MSISARTHQALNVLLLLLAAGLASCATLQTDVTQGGNLKSYKRAYIETLPQDEFQIYRALFFELNDMGLEIVGVPYKEPTETDLIVKYTYDSGWDLTRYLQGFQFQFINGKTGRVVAVSSFRSRGLWLGVRDGRLESAFNDLRTKNGYPPTKQFQQTTQ